MQNGKSGINKIDVIILTVFSGMILFFSMCFSASCPYPQEDAAITLRYAENLAAGHGVVWNVGEKSVGGQTDFLIVFFIAALMKLGLTAGFSIRCISTLSQILLIIVVYLAIRRFYKKERWMAVLSGGFLALGVGLRYTQVYFGTNFFTLFICLTWYFANKFIREKSRDSTILAFVFLAFISGLARPEGVFASIFMLLAILSVKGLSSSRKLVIYFLVVFCVVGGMHLLWRWNYFGDPLPTSFLQKGGGSLYICSLLSSIEDVVKLSLPFSLFLAYAIMELVIKFFIEFKSFKYVFIATVLGVFLLSGCILKAATPEDLRLYLANFVSHYSIFNIGIGTLLFCCCLSIPVFYLFGKFFLSKTVLTRELSGDLFAQTRFLLIPVLGFATIWILLSSETNYASRFQYPIVPVILMSWPALLTAICGIYGYKSFHDLDVRHRIKLMLVTGLVAICSIALQQVLSSTLYQGRKRLNGRYDVAMILKDYMKKDYSLAVSEAGILPLFSGWRRAIDAWGLNDLWIAKHGGITEEYLDKYKPEMIMFYDWDGSYLSLQDKNSIHIKSGVNVEKPHKKRIIFTPLKREQWTDMVMTLGRYAKNNGYVLAASFGPLPQRRDYYFVKRGFPEGEEIIKRIRDVNYHWFENAQDCKASY